MSIAELRKLPAEEKIKIIELLWADLAGYEESLPIPPWHAEELQKTEADYAAGKLKVLDWEEVKAELIRRFK